MIVDDEIGKLIGYTQILKVDADSIAGKQAGVVLRMPSPVCKLKLARQISLSVVQ